MSFELQVSRFLFPLPWRERVRVRGKNKDVLL